MNKSEPTAPLTDDDIDDLLAAPRRQAVRQRALLWAALAPDGLILSTFGTNRSASNLAGAEQAARSRGFVLDYEPDCGYEPIVRIRRRWTPPHRPGIAAFATATRDAANGPSALCWISNPDHADLTCELLHTFNRHPGVLEILLPLPQATRRGPSSSAQSAYDEAMISWVRDSLARIDTATAPK
jgi:hypothetical protein